MKQIPTSQTILSFRSIPTLRPVDYRVADCTRAIAGMGKVRTHESLRRWRNQMWMQYTSSIE